jgi:hypothetical protein
MKSGIDTLTVTILPETKVVDGVKVGVLEERETKDGKLIEISFNYFATDKNTGDVYYFGEDVDNYKDGKVINHESAWHAGEKGARFGLMIPGKPQKGDKYYQEIAPKVALDRVESSPPTKPSRHRPEPLNIASTSRKPPRWKPMSATSTTRQA